MILLWIILIPLLAGSAALVLAQRNRGLSMGIMTGALALDLLLLGIAMGGDADANGWVAQWSANWIPPLGARIALAADGMALLLCVMTCGAGLVAVLGLAGEEREHPGLHAFCMMSLVASLLGVFLANDMLFFFFCFEAMLLPSAALIAFWGHGERVHAAITFFVFTQAGGLLLFAGIATLYAVRAAWDGTATFDPVELVNSPMPDVLRAAVLMTFLAGFFVKLPVVPFHTWQPITYAAAPPEAAILLAAVMAKTAGFGLFRFVLPMFPAEVASIAPVALWLGVATVLYCGWTAFGQQELRRLIAYSSAGHLGFVVLAAFSGSEMAQRGAILLMLAHGLSVTGLFVVTWIVERATGTSRLDELGGLWHASPMLGRAAMVFVMATLGLPGLANFVGEFVVLAGVFPVYPVHATIAAIAPVLSAAYALRIMQRVFFGPSHGHFAEINVRPGMSAACLLLVLALIGMGFFPRPWLAMADIAQPVAAVTAEAGETP
jgi:NADH-quinone oxidoreductase subunit M